MLSLLLAAALVATPADGQDPQKLVAVLRSDAPPAEKAITCKRLAVWGNKEAVPALAPLLADEKLASWARIALENIPDPACDAALRDAAGKLQGRLLIGVINSIGVRRDVVAIPTLTSKLKDADPDVAAAAAVALGKIGSPAAAAALTPLLTTAPDRVRPAVAQGCILCAERFLADGKSSEAVKLYDAVRAANISPQKTLEAIRGAILARGPEGLPLLVEQLKSPDKALFGMGLRVAREIPGSAVTRALVAEMEHSDPDRQACLLLTLLDRRDTEALPSALRLAKSGQRNVRLIAIGVLDQLGNAAAVPVLQAAAVEEDVDISQAARSALIRLPGAEADAAAVAMLKQPQEDARRVAIELIGARQIKSALPALLQVAEDANANVARASLKVIGDIAGITEIPALLALLTKNRDIASIENALVAICARQTDRAACADKLLPSLSQAHGQAKLALLRVLRATGGPKALAAIRAAANEADPEVKETALRVLCDWPTPEALPDLARLVQTATDRKWKILALRGQLRLIPQQDTGPAQKLASLKELTPMIERIEEKRLLLAALGEIPTADSLALVTTYLRDNSLKQEAAIAAVAVAEKIVGKHPAEVAEAMALVDTKDKKLAQKAKQLQAQAKKK